MSSSPLEKPRPKPEFVEIVVIQASGRFDGDVWAWAEYLKGLADEYGASIMSCTEVQQPKAWAAFSRAFGPEWRIQRFSEHFVLTYKPHVARHMVKPPTGSTGRPKPFRPRRVFATGVPGLAEWRQMTVGAFRYDLTIAGGIPLRVLPFHAPAEVQDGDRHNTRTLKNRMQVAASKWGFRRLGKNCQRWFSSHPRGVQIAQGDSNYDVKRGVWMRWLRDRLGGFPVWLRAEGSRGTHAGGRRIDIAHVWNAVVLWVKVVGKNPPAGFDHTPFVYAIKVRVRD